MQRMLRLGRVLWARVSQEGFLQEVELHLSLREQEWRGKMARGDMRLEAEGELQFMRVSEPSQGIQGLLGARHQPPSDICARCLLNALSSP